MRLSKSGRMQGILLPLGMCLLLLVLTACSENNRGGSSARPGNTTSSAQNEDLETLRALTSAPAGLNTQRLFIEAPSDPQWRFRRVENEVQRLRDDFDLVSPSITRLVAVEQDMRDLMAQLEILIMAEDPNAVLMDDTIQPQAITDSAQQDTVTQAPETIAESSATVSPAAEAEISDAETAPVSITGMRLEDVQTTPTYTENDPLLRSFAVPSPTAEIKNIRIGEHIDKTRIVMDVKGQTDFMAQMSSDGRVLQVILPHADWQEAESWSSETSPVIKAWKAAPLPSGGYAVVFEIVERAHIKHRELLPPLEGATYDRLVIDVFSHEMHLEE